MSFNPRARAGRDFDDEALKTVFARFQSTRPRGARRNLLFLDVLGVGVSIHAPARGATCDVNSGIRRHRFQSTRPRGARRLVIANAYRPNLVSIHAPARGATPDITHVVPVNP